MLTETALLVLLLSAMGATATHGAGFSYELGGLPWLLVEDLRKDPARFDNQLIVTMGAIVFHGDLGLVRPIGEVTGESVSDSICIETRGPAGFQMPDAPAALRHFDGLGYALVEGRFMAERKANCPNGTILVNIVEIPFMIFSPTAKATP